MKRLICLLSLALLPLAVPSVAAASHPSLDPSFAGGGALIERGFGEQRVVADGSGHLLAAALAPGGISVLRLRSDGSRDPSFGAGGAAFIPLRGARFGSVTDVAVQPNGKILVAATYSADGGEGYVRTTPVLARLDTDGGIDTGFGGFGHLWETPGLIVTKKVRAIIVRDREIVVAGGDEQGLSAYVGRFHLDGSHDSEVGQGGWVSVPPRYLKELPTHGNIGLSGLLSGRGGSYYATGWANGKLMVARFRRSGELAAGFGTHGIVLSKVRGYRPCHCLRVADAAEDRNGHLLLVGTTNSGSGYPTKRAPHLVVLARYRRDGRLDRGFGGGDGIVYAAAGSPLRFNSRGSGVAVQPDGRIAVAGSSATAHTGSNDGPARFTVFRFLPNGHRDRGFFGDGIFRARFGAYSAEATQALAQPPGGRLVVAGSTAFQPRYSDLRGIITRFRG
jgi:uncharacterized delta-60 repeat protein